MPTRDMTIDEATDALVAEMEKTGAPATLDSPGMGLTVHPGTPKYVVKDLLMLWRPIGTHRAEFTADWLPEPAPTPAETKVVQEAHSLEDVLMDFSTQEGSPYLRLPGFIKRFPNYASELREMAEELSVEAHNRLVRTERDGRVELHDPMFPLAPRIVCASSAGPPPAPAAPAFDPAKPVRTTDGHEAEIVATDLAGVWPIAAVVKSVGGEKRVQQYTGEGKWRDSGAPHPLDLVNVPERHVRWVASARRMIPPRSLVFDREQDARDWLAFFVPEDRIACIRVEFEAGEGLTR